MTDSVLDARMAPRSLARGKAFSFSRLAIHATLILACAVYLVPLLVMLLTSFKTPTTSAAVTCCRSRTCSP